MLRITVSKKEGLETWELEGRLSGEWVNELEQCWKHNELEAGAIIQVYLKAVSYVDAAGKQLLMDMYEQGVDIRGCGCMARAVAEEIARNSVPRGSQVLPE